MRAPRESSRRKSAPAKTSHQKLTDEEKRKIFDIVAAKMAPDDREPQEVIRTAYHGNVNRWCKDMIKAHNIQL